MGYRLAIHKQDLQDPQILTEIEVPTERDNRNKPSAMPQLSSDEVLIFAADRFIYVELIVIEHFAEMLNMYQGYMQGRCMNMIWYKAKRSNIAKIPRAS